MSQTRYWSQSLSQVYVKALHDHACCCCPCFCFMEPPCCFPTDWTPRPPSPSLLCKHQGCRMMHWDLGCLKTGPSCFQPEPWQGRLMCGPTYSLRSWLKSPGMQQARRQLPWPALNPVVCCLGGSVVLGCSCTIPHSEIVCQKLLSQVRVENVSKMTHFDSFFRHVPWQSRWSCARSVLLLTKEK